jgi:RNA polymerase sigma-70 factor (ECF subfamily)
LPAGADPVTALGGLQAADLYLAYGCVAGNTRALEALDETMLVPLGAQLARSGAALAEDVIQTLRARMLVPHGATPPRLASYNGRGPLAVWLRVTAARINIHLQHAQRPHEGLDAAPEAGVLPRTADPELAFLKTHYRQELADAFRATIVALPAREANLLRLHYLEQANAETIAGIYGTSVRSVQRWITQAKRRILAETRRVLGQRLRLSDAETDSIMGLARSQLDITLHTMLDRKS